MVRSSATDVVPMVVQLIPLFVGKLQETCQLQPQSAEAAERQSEIQVRQSRGAGAGVGGAYCWWGEEEQGDKFRLRGKGD